jgi:hypothetical protein
MTRQLLLHPLLGLQGLKVVRMAAKSRESIGSSVEHLTLHHQVCGTLLVWRLSFVPPLQSCVWAQEV